jgi:hypothetical protein
MTTIDHDILLELCSGDVHAVSLIEGVWEFVEMYDDLVDGDRHPENAVHKSMDFVLFGLNANPCYRSNPVLQHSLYHAIVLWKVANSLERTRNPDALNVSYTLRCSPFNFFVSVVLCVGGMEKAIRAAELFYDPGDDDTLASYVLEHIGKD